MLQTYSQDWNSDIKNNTGIFTPDKDSSARITIYGIPYLHEADNVLTDMVIPLKDDRWSLLEPYYYKEVYLTQRRITDKDLREMISIDVSASIKKKNDLFLLTKIIQLISKRIKYAFPWQNVYPTVDLYLKLNGIEILNTKQLT